MTTRGQFSLLRTARRWRTAAAALTVIALSAGLPGAALAEGNDIARGVEPDVLAERLGTGGGVEIDGLDLADATFTQIAAGYWHGVGLAQDGSLWTWGDNTYGQLGSGTSTSSTVPVRVDMTGALAGKEIEQVVSGLFHSAVLTTDGQVYTWGENAFGQLGDGTSDNSSTPVAVDADGVLAGKTVVSLSTGTDNLFVTAWDGTSTWIYAWGRNDRGQLGDETLEGALVPVAVSGNGAMPSSESIQMVAAGEEHTVALAANGTLYAWGHNTWGQLGDGSRSAAALPIKVDVGDEEDPTIQIALSTFNTIALSASGSVHAWGANYNGQLGTGSMDDHSSIPVLVTALEDQRVTEVSVGADHSVAITAEGEAFVWGANVYGQLGNGDFTSKVRAPISLGNPGALENESLTSVTSNDFHNLALTTTGQVVGWGRNYGGALGNGEFSRGGLRTPVPTQLLTHVVRFGVAQATGADTRVDLAAGTITARKPENTGGWVDVVVNLAGAPAGANDDDEKVAGESDAFDGGFVVSGLDLSDARFTQVVGGGNHSVGLAADGSVWAWGSNSRGQLGDDTTTSAAVPVRVDMTGVLAGKQVAQVAAGREHSAVLTTDGMVFTWGGNRFGQLGDAGSDDSAVPVPVDTSGALAGKTVTGISAGMEHVLVAATDEDSSTWVYGWGANASGQLGDDTIQDARVPVAVSVDGLLPGTDNISAVAAGDDYSIAVTETGNVSAWGSNASGQLGDGTHDSSTTPVQTVLPDTAGDPVVQITAGAQHAHAITQAGRVYGWGSNTSGQVGAGQGADNPTPTLLTALDGQHVTAVSAGADHTVATTADGRGFVWGSNEHGQLGNDDITGGIATPIALNHPGALEGQTIAGVQAGGHHNLALTTTGQVITWGRNTTGQLGNTATTDAPTPVPGQLHTHAFRLGDDRIPAAATAVDLATGTLTAHRPARGDRWVPLTISLAAS